MRFQKSKRLIAFLMVFAICLCSFSGTTAFAATEISSLVLNKNEVSLEVGETFLLTATAIYTNGSTENVTVKTDWNSGAPNTASVYAGSITAKQEGTAVITATYMEKMVVVNVKVSKRVRSLIKDVQTIDLRKGASQQIGLTAYYDDGTNEGVTTKAEWNIDNGSVATVVNGLVTGQSSGTATVTAKYNNQTVSIPVNIEIVKRVDPNLSEVSLLLKDDVTIKLTATYPDGSTKDVTELADWDSENPDVADVIKGKITGYGPGQTKIIATYGTKSTAIKVDVDNAVKLGLDKQTVMMKKNASEQLTLTATYPDGSTDNITARAEWTSSNEDVLSVVKGKLFASAAGEATVTASYGGKSVTAVIDVDVPRRLLASQDSLYVQSGQDQQLTLTAVYADNSTSDVTTDAKWSSDNEDVATVSKGNVVPRKAGEATIKAVYGDKSVTIKVSVDIPNILVPNKKTVSFQMGSYEQMVLKALYTDGREVDVTSKAEWTSSAPAVAEVRNGLITGVGTGVATVTAKFGTRTTVVQVSVGVLKSLTTTSDTQFSMAKGSSKTIDLTATYTDGTVNQVASEATWTSSNASAVSVDAGVVKAIASGDAVITASFETKTITLNISVDMADSLTASPAFLSFDLGESRAITLTAKNKSGEEKNVTNDAEWASSNVQIVQVSAGVVTPVSRGKATVTAKYGGKSVSVSVEIGVAQSLDTDKKFLSVKRGQSTSIALTATQSDGSKKVVSADAQWKSSNYKVADVSGGVVTAVGSGKATITGTFGGKSITVPVEVDTLKYLKTDIILISIKQGASVEAKATATYSDLSEEDVTIPAMWSSSSIRVADVKDGVIKAISKGKATVTVNYGDKRTYIYVTVD
ncbi:hypothetical protein PAESOLCIP111_05804 [Paenibacillus solanacearum]|uniref:BIG2 domain-containing protein n=1 Tax=Paenibacillus solanacearum TaxID=2048548 RepID=A0A916NLL8_9BACL|nr:Ig-like domain-containing protein [Paenibacillus solanacearum]CAG7649155.1 hypothetical protein PAESOLCIP111_05804 [Paenibacillus solanacearum]